jgi:hypothetical protein
MYPANMLRAHQGNISVIFHDLNWLFEVNGYSREFREVAYADCRTWITNDTRKRKAKTTGAPRFGA